MCRNASAHVEASFSYAFAARGGETDVSTCAGIACQMNVVEFLSVVFPSICSLILGGFWDPGGVPGAQEVPHCFSRPSKIPIGGSMGLAFRVKKVAQNWAKQFFTIFRVPLGGQLGGKIWFFGYLFVGLFCNRFWKRFEAGRAHQPPQRLGSCKMRKSNGTILPSPPNLHRSCADKMLQ